MAAIHDLLAQVQDEELQSRLEQEINRLTKTKKFGLVFEDHLPECTPLYDIPVRRGCIVAKRAGTVSEIYEVNSIKDGVATCYHKVTEEKEEILADDLVCVAQFGEPIYPYLKLIDSVCNAPNSDLWHTLIEADNYHALQLLKYLYAGNIDCIYIDPPYNTGAKDWKYNNDYVDGSDAYRHSKWLSMMEKRLKLAKKLLNPKDSVLIVTIDEKEYLHLGCLLEELFSEAKIQMVSITINPSGAKRDGLFSRADEYAFFVLLGNANVTHPKGVGEEQEVRWWYLRRTDYSSRRGTVKGGVAQFYPIYVDNLSHKIVKIGEPLLPEDSITDIETIAGTTAVFPIREDGVEMNWGLTGESLKKLVDEGVVRVTEGTEKQPYVFRYLSANYKTKIKQGRWAIRGERPDGTKIVVETEGKVTRATTVWQNKLYDAGQYGTSILKQIIGDGRFSFPKSVYAVEDTLRYFIINKPNALVLDFFAGSGTTLHAVNLLNAEDGGNRRCIMVTNNEVSEAESKTLMRQGYKPSDEEWEQYGIARYVTWPRTVCSIEGHDVNGQPLKGNYLNSELPMSDGFKSNAIYFKLGFLDKTSVALGRQLAELMSVLWLKAGAHGVCPELTDENAPFLILQQNKFAVLIDEKYYQQFTENVMQKPEIETIYIITDSEAGYREMILPFTEKDTYQLYRDYLDNFRINTGR
ncbi:MAG: site-specific DNA-methyltransferase [Clostridiales bacterium]|nr:site-specific DNA-methyltransferase [Clostridiales bacterium]